MSIPPVHDGWVLYNLNLRDRAVNQVPLADMICEGTQGLMTAGANGRWRESVQTIANEGSNRSPAYTALASVVSEGTHPVCDSWGTEQEIIAYNRNAFGFGNKGTAKANGQLAEILAEKNQMYLLRTWFLVMVEQFLILKKLIRMHQKVHYLILEVIQMVLHT